MRRGIGRARRHGVSLESSDSAARARPRPTTRIAGGRRPTRIAAALVGVVLAALLLGGTSLWLLRATIDPGRQILVADARTIADAERLRSLSERRAREARAYLLTWSPDAMRRYDEANARFLEQLRELQARAEETRDKALLGRIARDHEAASAAFARLTAAGKQAIPTVAERFNLEPEPLRDNLDEALDDLVDSREGELDRALNHIGSAYSRALVSLAIAVAAAVALSAFVAVRLGRSMRALEQSEERFRATFDCAAVGIARVRLDGRWLDANQQYCELLGYDRSELALLSLADVTHADDREADEALTSQLLRGETATYSTEQRYIRKDGSPVWVDLTCSLVRAYRGEPLYIIVVAADITERRAAEEALRRERDFSTAILDTVCALVIVLDRSARIVRWNRACERVTGYSAEEMRGEVVWEHLIMPDDIESGKRVFAELCENGSANIIENNWVAKDGSVRRIAWSSTVLLGEDGQVEHIIGTGIDVTDQRRAEEQRSRLYQDAQDAIRVRDEFLSIASHELKTPLTPLALQVSSILRALRKGPLPVERLLPKMETIHRQIDRLIALIADLLDISRITAGRLGLRLEEVDLAAVARDVASRLNFDLGRAGCRLEVRAGRATPGQWDRARLDQIVTNLLSNAIKYGAGKPILLEVGGDERVARLVVRDQGIGISPEHQARIFDRFERAVPDQHYGGFGLGLWIVKQILDALGGTIHVDSEPGKGATFTVELPRRPEIQADAAA